MEQHSKVGEVGFEYKIKVNMNFAKFTDNTKFIQKFEKCNKKIDIDYLTKYV